MKIDDIKLMFDYNVWANHLILDMAEQVTLEQLWMPQSVSWGSLGGTLVHNMDTEFGWRILIQKGFPTPVLKNEDFPDVAAIRARWTAEESDMQAYLDSLTDEDMETVIRYQGDVPRERVLWHCLWHVVNHGMQHRSECAAMLTNFGYSPGDLDFTLYLNNHPRQ
ncbi:DinB family protein [Phototrophicus methaneseepsis]|uniref:DinB family protein n=1 Tax=Phototrophicus methaneseepsis TaxID=2710758 RepID=A0A7S8E8G5_9CHLR|nr:DinB family protein [Phototrophicus methaneseepsis]QPC82330.1 DinB family protein [Phototrophicus methaneseepsis]